MESPQNTLDKSHWYDGLFYDLLIAPHQDRAFVRVRDLIAEGSTVLDIGCGTGRLAFQLAGKCGTIDAIDPSMRNIDIARRNMERHPSGNIRFHHADALRFLEQQKVRFDFAAISYVIHEIEETQREHVLQTVSSAARRLILVDYLVPRPVGHRKMLNAAVEFAAGASHYRNFRSFIAGKGLTGLVERAGLTLVKEFKDDPPSTHIVLAEQQTTGTDP